MQDAVHINNVKVETLGFSLGFDKENKLKNLIDRLLELVPAKDISIKLYRTDKVYEGILWCEASNMPIGTYKRNVSLSRLLDNLFKKTSREYRRIAKYSFNSSQKNTPFKIYKQNKDSFYRLTA